MDLLIPTILTVSLAIYLLLNKFHNGLHRIPGPLCASFTDFWKVWYASRGSNHRNDTYVDTHREYGDIVRIGPNNVVFADPLAIQEIYGTKGSQQKSPHYDTFSMPVKGHQFPSLLSSLDQKWHDQQRKLINTAFSATAILKYEPWVDDTINVLLRELKSRFLVGKGQSESLELYTWLAYFAADVISDLTYGQRTGFLETGTDVLGIQGNVEKVFQFWLLFAQMPILDRLTFKNPLLLFLNRHGIMESKKPLLSIVHRHFEARKKIWEEKDGREGDRVTLIDRFLQAQRDNAEKVPMPPERHAVTMVTAGSETTAITLASIFYFLMKNPECYTRLQEEVDAITPDQLHTAGDSMVFPWRVAQTMPYLDACIREAMRLHPAQRIPHNRVVPEAGLVIRGQFIPGSTEVGIYPSVLHRRKEVFGDDVETYRPERWLEDSQKTERMKASMFTFSYGKYNCLGQNISRLEIYKLVPSVMRALQLQLKHPDREWELKPGAFAMPKELPVYLNGRV
ncbi:cytochrome P450-like protein [Periconia macrospinosa]|uniref:Cytochrome P450-like protein n=1 Tax=Periconia macrospinosa TaxID=97972 RepID=A0A2V1DGU0_9PLEO|nr:cytochrome P450-like protein [Periconia macrospinosa]